MFNLFKKRCPVCRMELEKGKDNPREYGRTFCSDQCVGVYREEMKSVTSKHGGGGCCH